MIKNLGSDMVDGVAYGHVLQNVAESFDKSYWKEGKDKRAVMVIETCEH